MITTVRDEAGLLPQARRRALDRLMLLLQEHLAPEMYATAEGLVAEAFNEAGHQSGRAEDAAGTRRIDGALVRDAAIANSTVSAMRNIQARFPGIHVRRA